MHDSSIVRDTTNLFAMDQIGGAPGAAAAQAGRRAVDDRRAAR